MDSQKKQDDFLNDNMSTLDNLILQMRGAMKQFHIANDSLLSLKSDYNMFYHSNVSLMDAEQIDSEIERLKAVKRSIDREIDFCYKMKKLRNQMGDYTQKQLATRALREQKKAEQACENEDDKIDLEDLDWDLDLDWDSEENEG